MGLLSVFDKCSAYVSVDGVPQAPMTCRGILTRSAGLAACPAFRVARAVSAAVGRAQAPFARQHQPQPAGAD